MHRIWLVLGLWATGATCAQAAVPDSSCAPVLKAMTKTFQKDHSATTQRGTDTITAISAGGVNYLKMGGGWKVSPSSPRDDQSRMEENHRNAKSYTCKALSDSTIDGTAVSNYLTHTDSEAIIDSTLSIAKATGLVLQVGTDMDLGDGPKTHYVTRYSYVGIQAPTVAK